MTLNTPPLRLTPLSFPISVTFGSMVAAKLTNALRPSRMLLFLLAACALGAIEGVKAEISMFLGMAYAIAFLLFLRFIVICVSAALDVSARRRFTGILTVKHEGLELVRPDGTSETHDWGWILGVRLTREQLGLRIAERLGNVWVFISLAQLDRKASLLEHLRASGKL